MNHLIESLENRTLLSATLDVIAAQDVPGGKSIFVPVTGLTDNTTRVSYNVSSSNGQLSAQSLANLTFLRIKVSIGGVNAGTMEFALFNDIAPNAVARITALVNSGFYNNLNFHRVIPGFMAQGGDPLGTGAGGSGVKFDDEFNGDAIFSTKGQLAMANSGADTNDSQFFITDTDTRWLDFKHTIFGQLIRGQAVLDKIIKVGSADGTTSKPVTITAAKIVANKADTVLLLKGTGTSTITVKAQDQNSTATRTFSASAYEDNVEDPPFLNYIPSQQTVSDLPLNFTVGTTDIDGGTLVLQAIPLDKNQLTVTYSGTTVTVTPVNGFSGEAKILVGVMRADKSWDQQVVNVVVLPGPFAQYDAATRQLNINATSGNDTLDFAQSGGDIAVSLNGHRYDFGLFAISSINVNLGDGNDRMTAQAGITVPFSATGGLGNDYIFGAAGNDTISGGDGDDILNGGPGNDYIDCGAGHDESGGQAGWDTIIGGPGRDTLRGGDNADVLRGGGAADSISGGKGMDSLYGAGGNDTLNGQDGADWLYGGEADDSLVGGTKLDHLFGDAGNDVFYSIDGASDTLDGGLGTDTAHVDRLLDVATGVESLLFA